jgi:hypothetical protein
MPGMKSKRSQHIIAMAALAGFVWVGVYGSFLGWGTDRDSVRVIQSARSILDGHYLPSRSWGFPLHEVASAMLYGVGGLLAVNLGSVAATSLGILAALHIVRILARTRLALAALLLCGSPLLLANVSAAIDFGWDFAAGMGLLSAALSVQFATSALTLAAFFTATLAMLLLRPDNVLFAAAVTIALLGHGQQRARILAAALAAGLLAAAIYLWLNGVAHLLNGVSTTRPWLARAARATVLGSAALGPGGALALALLARSGSAPEPAALLRRVCWLAWLLYLPRFAALPDQADYLILPVQLSLLLAACSLSFRDATVCTVLTALPALVTVSIFQRTSTDGRLELSVAPQWGTVEQDWAARRFAMAIESPRMAAFVVAHVHGPGAPTTLTYDPYLPGFRSLGGDLVIGREHLYRVVPAGRGLSESATVRRSLYGVIWACDAALGPGIGWRGWEAPTSSAALRAATSGELSCRRADPS